jgi:hypothetical protein
MEHFPVGQDIIVTLLWNLVVHFFFFGAAAPIWALA